MRAGGALQEGEGVPIQSARCSQRCHLHSAAVHTPGLHSDASRALTTAAHPVGVVRRFAPSLAHTRPATPHLPPHASTRVRMLVAFARPHRSHLRHPQVTGVGFTFDTRASPPACEQSVVARNVQAVAAALRCCALAQASLAPKLARTCAQMCTPARACACALRALCLCGRCSCWQPCCTLHLRNGVHTRHTRHTLNTHTPHAHARADCVCAKGAGASGRAVRALWHERRAFCVPRRKQPLR
eukprot:162885-Chlamydomonas_euryale.AAC.1